MITRSNLVEMLKLLGFTLEKHNVYIKTFEGLLFSRIEVDFGAQKIKYPEEITINDETTCNFAHPENFVVLECVVRLLEKGYRPEHIELEKRWKLGHEEKSGKADICVYDSERRDMLLIIECKTYGSEYAKEKKNLLANGGQLFSYWQQERRTKWLALYASDIQDGEIVYNNDIINCSDDKNILLLAEKDNTIKLFKDAGTVEELFEVWQETYNQDFYRGLIFGPDTVAYQIGVKPLRKKDLRDFIPDEKIVNRFEEILRHNNVSDKENAFNRLIALFICKLVDEIGKDEKAEMEFQYKQGTDTYETLQDRLQKLHQKGMNDFMKEKIFYVPDDYAEKLVQSYSGQKRKALIAELQRTIHNLKFYTNNDFSFKDVHNEELFYQNGKIVVEVVKLFEKNRIVYPSKYQILGDLFEQLLNKGFKQNEGQFFTPMPITRFIWDSLPLDRFICNSGEYTFPKIIDYACGAGHFLTEAVEAVNKAMDRHGQSKLTKDNSWVGKSIYGIEKDYRLARVSKISLFMNGAGLGNIIFGDGLDNYPEKQINPNSFDILVANPPYAVKAFKAHFKPKNNDLKLLECITNDGSEIEVLFVERIAQLVKPNGIAAVILPASILSNTSNSYIAARESLLENFRIHAIAQFGSKTFGATGTNTVVLFLEKYNEPPKRKDLVTDSAAAIQSGNALPDWEDRDILQGYLAKIEVSAEDYELLLKKNMPVSHWENHAYFGQFVKAFLNSTEVKNKQKQQSFKKLPKDKQDKWLREKFYEFVFEVEKDKIKFFALVYMQKTLVVTAPSDNEEQKEFLGYDWSNRKGAEGIQISNPGGKLYNDENRVADNTIAAAIRRAFSEYAPADPDFGKYLAWYRLQDLIDFSRRDFNKEIKTTAPKVVEITNKWNLSALDSLIQTIETGSRPKGGVGAFTSGALSIGGEHIGSNSGRLDLSSPKFVPYQYFNEVSKGKLRGNDILICKDGAQTGKVAIIKNELDGLDAMCNEHVYILRCKDAVLQNYVFQILSSSNGQKLLKAGITGSAQGGLNLRNLKQTTIPLPPSDIQKKIVIECNAIDFACDKARQLIHRQRSEIETLVVSIFDLHYPNRSIDSVSNSVEYGSSAKSSKTGKVAVVRMGNIQNGRIDWSDLVYSNNDDEISKYQLKKYDVLFNRTNSPELVGKSAIYLGEQPAIFAGYLIRVNYKPEVINPFYLCYILNSKRIREHGFSVMSKSVNQANINGSLLKQYRIPVPPIKDQQALVDQILEKESMISNSNAILRTATARKQAILDKYLQ